MIIKSIINQVNQSKNELKINEILELLKGKEKKFFKEKIILVDKVKERLSTKIAKFKSIKTKTLAEKNINKIVLACEIYN